MWQVYVSNGKAMVNDTVVAYSSKMTAVDVLNMFPELGDITSLYCKEDIVSVYKKAGDIMGCSLKQMANMINGVIYKAYIKPNEKWHARFSIRNGVLIHTTVKAVNDNITLLNRYVDNGIGHMAAYALLFGPKAKTTMGFQLWIEVRKNAASRNDQICKLLQDAFNPDNYVAGIKFLNMLPSTILRRCNSNSLEALFHYGIGSTSILTIISNYIRKHKGQYKHLDMYDVRHRCAEAARFLEVGKFLGLDDTRLAKYMTAKLNK